MKLSVVIPVYNTKEYLPECINSVLRQTFHDYEIILVDDGSTDGSAQMCDDYREQNTCVRVIHRANAGASAARNTGIAAASGEYIHFVDSDDLLPDDNVYQRLAEQMDGSHQIIFSRRIRFRDGESQIDAVQAEYDVKGRLEGDILNHVLSHKYGMTLTCPVNKIFKRSLAVDNEVFFREGLNHEEDEWLPRLISCADIAYFDDGILYKVRVRKGSLSEIPSEENRTDKACSKVIIAASGMAYMEKKALPPETMSLAAEYYWDYLTDACADCSRLSSKENRKKVYDELRKNKAFFKSAHYLKSKNRQIMGWMFRVFGVVFTVRFIGIRYGK